MNRAEPGEYRLKFGPFRRCTLDNIARAADGLEYLAGLQDRDRHRRFLFDETRETLNAFLEQERLRDVLPAARERARKRRAQRSAEFKDGLFGYRPEHPAFEYGCE